MRDKQTINQAIEKQQAIIDLLKVEKNKIKSELILNHSVVVELDTVIWKKSEKLLELYDELLEL